MKRKVEIDNAIFLFDQVENCDLEDIVCPINYLL